MPEEAYLRHSVSSNNQRTRGCLRPCLSGGELIIQGGGDLPDFQVQVACDVPRSFARLFEVNNKFRGYPGALDAGCSCLDIRVERNSLDRPPDAGMKIRTEFDRFEQVFDHYRERTLSALPDIDPGGELGEESISRRGKVTVSERVLGV